MASREAVARAGGGGRLTFRILGPLEVTLAGKPIAVGGPKKRALLAYLLLHHDTLVRLDSLVHALWADPPASATTIVRLYVSQLRRALAGGGRELLVTEPRGYTLRLGGARLDLATFEHALERSREAAHDDRPELVVSILRKSLRLCRGAALADLQDEAFVEAERRRLEDLRLSAHTLLLDAELELGWHEEIIPELSALVRDHPLHERFREQLIVALYRSGRQADALREYRAARETLDATLGVEPGPTLRRLQHAILTHDPSLGPPAAARPVHVPMPPTPLVDREAETDDALALLRDRARLVTLSGPGGVGKTRLAIELAHRLAAELPGRTYFVDLGPVSDASLVLPAIAQGMGLDVRDERGVGSALGRRLRGHQALLVLDSFEHLLSAAPRLGGLLAAVPELRLLVTSRVVLGISGEHVLSLRPLPVPSPDGDPLAAASAALFVERARAARPDVELGGESASAVGELCRRLDGLPLAIEIAAARCRVLSPPALLEHMRARLDVAASAARDAPARQQTLRATLDWSYELLPDHARRALATLSVFIGGFELPAAAAVCGDEALTAVATLVDNSLVWQEPCGERFAMLDTVREYGLALLSADEEEDARRRHAAWYERLVHRCEEDLKRGAQREALSLLDRELANVRAALAFAIAADPALALRIATRLRTYWWLRGHLAEGRETVARALAVAGDGPAELVVRAWTAVGIYAAEQGDYEGAREAFEHALEEAHRGGVVAGVAGNLTNLAVMSIYEGDDSRARTLFRESLALNTSEGNERGRAVALRGLAGVERRSGDLVRAIELCTESIAAAKAVGDRVETAKTQRQLAVARIDGADFAAAAAALRDGLALATEVGNSQIVAEMLETLAALEARAGRPGEASMLLDAAAVLRHRIGARLPPDEEAWLTGALGRPLDRTAPADDGDGGLESALELAQRDFARFAARGAIAQRA